MENSLIVITEYDIPAALKVAENLVTYKTYTFDPGLVDRLIESKLSNVEFLNWEDSANYADLHKSAHALAFEIEKELSKAAKEVIPDISIFSWQHLNFYYLFMATGWYPRLWNGISERIEHTKPHVFICDSPSQYYWPSFVPGLSLLEILKAKDIEFSAYHYGERPDETNVVPMLFGDDDASKTWELLTHLPTCFYDCKYFDDEIRASGKSIINILPKYWHPPICTSETINLTRIEDLPANLPADFRKKVEAFSDLILVRLDKLLAPHIRTASYRSRQARHISNLYRSQLITYYLLNQYFENRMPHKILLSDHDAGFHGPIISFAEKNHIPVVLVPHSKVTVDIEFNYSHVISLTHPIQGKSISDASGRNVLNLKIAYPENFSGTSVFPERLKKIGLLLNAISLNGVFVTAYTPYINGIIRIAQWCKKNNIALSIRCRPGHSLKNILASETDIKLHALEDALSGSMLDFAKANDLCLMYDTPTTGAIDFLRHSIPILNPVPEDIARHEECIANADVVPRGSVETILNTLDAFVSDTENFCAFRNTQFSNYLNLFQNAYSLRSFL